MVTVVEARSGFIAPDIHRASSVMSPSEASIAGHNQDLSFLLNNGVTEVPGAVDFLDGYLRAILRPGLNFTALDELKRHGYVSPAMERREHANDGHKKEEDLCLLLLAIRDSNLSVNAKRSFLTLSKAALEPFRATPGVASLIGVCDSELKKLDRPDMHARPVSADPALAAPAPR